MRWMPVLVAPGLFALSACGDSKAQPDAPMADTPMIDAAHDAPIDGNPNMPATLMDSGLCLDTACTQIAPGIKAYTPRWPLYSDGATKRRWIYLPAGTQIDTSNMDFWQFPVGTKVWKEFTRDNIRVETRLIMRVGSGDTVNDWFYVPYVWNQTQDATTAEPFGVQNANGTQHDVPSRQQCKTCHENTQPSRILGFSALQLDYNNANADELDLEALVSGNLLTNPPTAPGAAGDPYFPLPGNTTTEQPALGYLHANCGHCHNPSSQVYMNITQMQLRLTVGTLGSLAATPTYSTTVNVDGTPIGGRTKLAVPMQPDQSIMIYRFESTNTAERMPALGTEVMDPAGDTTLRSWITNLP